MRTKIFDAIEEACREETEKQENYFKQALRIDVSGQFVMDFRKELVNA